jgi:hypothetical protein
LSRSSKERLGETRECVWHRCIDRFAIRSVFTMRGYGYGCAKWEVFWSKGLSIKDGHHVPLQCDYLARYTVEVLLDAKGASPVEKVR